MAGGGQAHLQKSLSGILKGTRNAQEKNSDDAQNSTWIALTFNTVFAIIEVKQNAYQRNRKPL